MNNEQIEISIIIPSYNEEKRLPSYLASWLRFLPKYFKNYEIIIVEDGSTDGLSEIVRKMPEFNRQIKLIVKKHEGKGKTVQRGMMEASGKMCLFTDADGSTSVEELLKLVPFADDNSIVIGSRVSLSETSKITRNIFKHYRGRVFATLVSIISGVNVYDSQCGFKLFSKKAVKLIFPELVTSGWAFDVEVLLRAKRMGVQVFEIPVNWHDEKGSKIRPIKDSLRMFIDIFKIRRLVMKK